MSDNLEVALTRCFYCGDGNEILMNTRLTAAAAAQVKQVHNKVLNMRPCPKCEELMKQGIILITIDSSKSGEDWEKADIPNPHRTGGFFVVKEAAVERMFNEQKPALAFAKKHRWMFLEHEVAEKTGMFKMAARKMADSDK